MSAKEKYRQVGSKCRNFVVQNLLVTLSMLGVAIGFIVGFAIEPLKPSQSTLLWIGMAGELYIRLLKLMIVPLVVCSVISGTATMDPKSNSKIGAISMLYFLVTNCLAPVLASIVCIIVKPGVGVESDIDASRFDGQRMTTEDIFADLLRNIVPDNMVEATFQQAQTQYDYRKVPMFRTNGTYNWTEEVREITRKYVGVASSSNILGLIMISAVFGIVSMSMKEQGEPFVNFFRSAMDITIRILRVFMWATPVGVISLTAKLIAMNPDVGETFRKLGLYFVAQTTTMLLWSLVLMPILYYYVRRKNPYRFLASIVPSILIAFATCSSAITMAENFIVMEEKNRIDRRITRFVIPLAASVGRAGSAIYISTSCVFIIQLLDMEATFMKVFLVILLTWISALAIPGVMGSTLLTCLILLTSLNIPAESAAILFALEFIFDRARTVVNVITQCTGVVLTDKYANLGDQPDCHVTNYDDIQEDFQEENEKVAYGSPDDVITCTTPLKTVANGDIEVVNEKRV